MAKKDENVKAEAQTEEKKSPAKKAPAKSAKADEGKAASVKDLSSLKDAVKSEKKADEPKAVKSSEGEAAEKEPRKPMVDKFGRAYATGRRKDAVARVWIKPGKGTVIVNGRDQKVYFARQTQRLVLNQPFLISNRVGHFDVICTVKGGGLSGQAGAVRHGIARALQNFDPELRGPLKKAGMLTRDARTVERKKVGLHKARRSKQWAKR